MRAFSRPTEPFCGWMCGGSGSSKRTKASFLKVVLSAIPSSGVGSRRRGCAGPEITARKRVPRPLQRLHGTGDHKSAHSAALTALALSRDTHFRYSTEFQIATPAAAIGHKFEAITRAERVWWMQLGLRTSETKPRATRTSCLPIHLREEKPRARFAGTQVRTPDDRPDRT